MQERGQVQCVRLLESRVKGVGVGWGGVGVGFGGLEVMRVRERGVAVLFVRSFCCC